MPVKIRCRGCQKVLSAPDKARGKTIKCPNCQTKLKVPGGDAGAGQPAKKRPARTKPADDEGFLAGLDLSQQEHEEEQVCPYCAAEMELDQVVCRSCGMNIETGQMDAREKKKRARKGPDPAKFYKAAWSDSWEFLRSHWRLAFRTGLSWTVYAVLYCTCMFMMFYSTTGPPKFFWFCMSALSFLGFLGWYWYLAMQIVDATMSNNDKELEYINFDFMRTVALGVRLAFWPLVVFCPPVPVLMYYGTIFALAIAPLVALGGAMAQAEGVEGVNSMEAAQLWLIGFFAANSTFLVIVFIVTLPLTICFFPLATVHMTQKYTYKAWILWELIIVAAKNLVPALYYALLVLVLMLPVLLMTVVPVVLVGGPESGGNLFFSPRVTGNSIAEMNAYTVECAQARAAEQDVPERPREINGWTERAVAWCLALVDERPEANGFVFRLIVIVVNFVLAFLVYFPVCTILAFPAVFLMKVNGLLGHYNRVSLGLVNRIYPNTPATFWVRFLAYQIDLALWPFASLLVFKEKIVAIIGWLINAIIVVCFCFLPFLVPLLGPIWPMYNFWWYFAISEGTVLRTTIGKDAFGLIVSDLNDKQIPISKATLRTVGRLVCNLTFGLGYLIAAFHPQKRGLHDLIAGTKVVWRGDR